MTTRTASPLAQLVQQGINAIGARLAFGDAQPDPEQPSRTVEQLAGGLLAAMGLNEIADDLDLESVSLLGAASVVGLKVIGMAEPGVYRLEDALYALEDLLRRTADNTSRRDNDEHLSLSQPGERYRAAPWQTRAFRGDERARFRTSWPERPSKTTAGPPGAGMLRPSYAASGQRGRSVGRPGLCELEHRVPAAGPVRPRRDQVRAIAFSARLRGVDRHEAKRSAGRLVERLDLGRSGYLDAHGLVGVRRLPGSRQPAPRPHLLVLDEPTNDATPSGGRYSGTRSPNSELRARPCCW